MHKLAAAPDSSVAPLIPAKVLEICTYPPPRAGWSMRVELVKKQLEREGHSCVVLNTGRNRRVPSPLYETVLNPWDFARKVWRFSRAGYTVHEHVNGESLKGFARTLLALALNRLAGNHPYLTFHAGVDQLYFPKDKSPLLTPVYRVMFAIPQRIICNSANVKARIVEYGVPAEKVEPIPAFTRQYLEFETAPLPDHVEAFLKNYRQVLFCYVRIRPTFDLATLIDGFARVAAERPNVGLLLVGVTDDIDAQLWADVEQRIDRHRLSDRICIAEEFDHDAFLTALTRCSLYLRTPTSDGVASSVLEALALGVPTVAAENGTRPAGVVTYQSENAPDLAAKLSHVLDNLDGIAAAMPRPVIEDTLRREIHVLTSSVAVGA